MTTTAASTPMKSEDHLIEPIVDSPPSEYEAEAARFEAAQDDARQDDPEQDHPDDEREMRPGCRQVAPDRGDVAAVRVGAREELRARHLTASRTPAPEPAGRRPG